MLSPSDLEEAKKRLQEVERRMSLLSSQVAQKKAKREMLVAQAAELEKTLRTALVDVEHLDAWIEKELKEVTEEAAKVEAQLAQTTL